MNQTPSPTLLSGQPRPLGATVIHVNGTAGINFAVWAPYAECIELCLFDAQGKTELARVPIPTLTDGVWHGFLPGARAGQVYGYRAHGRWFPAEGYRFNPAKLLLDPWAHATVGSYGRQTATPSSDELVKELDLFNSHLSDDPCSANTLDNAAVAIKARVIEETPATDHQRPQIPYDQTVIYEAHVRSLTQRHPGIPHELRGSYAALAHPLMIEHYRALGITTLNLLPVHFRADERRLQLMGLSNHWGYSSLAFFAPETRYWSGRDGTTPQSELRDAIHTLHANDIEVILDVVYNHTAETDEFGPTLSYRGLANGQYYHLNKNDPSRYENWTGCGNCLNLAEPRVVELVIGSLRHWASHYGVDGFRFDLAPELVRNEKGEFSRASGFLGALQADPLLSTLKLIAEPWDIGPGGYRLGAFPAGWREWNDRYRDYMRGWWLRGHGNLGAFAHYFAGSAEQFHHSGRQITASVNFITAHDGFNLHDLVSYERKHNLANGEDNRDGHSHNNSSNFGEEGPTEDKQIQQLRQQMKRNLLTTLLCSQGIPMLLAGDEIGHSQQGNNNAYCQDNAISWLDWHQADRSLMAFLKRLIGLRSQFKALRQQDWLKDPRQAPDDWTVDWLNPTAMPMTDEQWHDDAGAAIAVYLRPRMTNHSQGDSSPILLLLNRAPWVRRFVLPKGEWQPQLDTTHPEGKPAAGSTLLTGGMEIEIAARSIELFNGR